MKSEQDDIDGVAALNERQRAFVRHYIKDRNATRAYMAAGYSATGNVATVNASRLLSRPEIAGEIERIDAEVLKKVQKRHGITLARTLEGVARSAFYDVRKLFNEDGSPKDVHELDDDTAMAIEGIEVVELFEGRGEERRNIGRVKKYKLANRTTAQDMLMKHLNAYKDNNAAPTNALIEFINGMRRSALPVVEVVEPDSGV